MGTDGTPQFLLETVTKLIACRGLHEFDQTLISSLAARFRFDAAGLYLYNQTIQAFIPVSEAFLNPESPGYKISQLPPEGTMKATAVEAGQAVLCHDMTAADWAEGRIIRESGYAEASAIVAPLILKRHELRDNEERTIGVMFVAALQQNAFRESDRLLLQELATAIAPALQRVLGTEERDMLSEISSRVVVGQVTLKSLIPAVKDIIQRVIPHDVHSLIRLIHTGTTRGFAVIHRDNFAIDIDHIMQYPFEQTAPGHMLATGRPVLLTGHEAHRFAEMSYIESLGIFSGMLCPLYAQQEPFGFLAIGSRRRNAFSERDLALAEQVSHHLSLAISNILAYTELHCLKDQYEREAIYLREEYEASADLDQLVGNSPPLQDTLRRIERVAPTESTVLITGETGTGKELVAQAIHRLSPRRQQPFIRVNCAALPPTLIESELFGHEKGAFTGATGRRMGRFELANNGTIFLDEIGELPLDLQSKLLRVLEAREFERVGGHTTINVNVRIVAATNQELQQSIGRGTFRADLFYRLNVFPIHVPALRERGDDIVLLAKRFSAKYAARHRKSITKISSSTLRSLAGYNWPGNVRELEHLIERAVILAQGSTLHFDDFTMTPQRPSPTSSLARKPITLAEADRAHILEALRQTNWVIAGANGAAALLGMKRSTLQHRMKKLAIVRPAQQLSSGSRQAHI